MRSPLVVLLAASLLALATPAQPQIATGGSGSASAASSVVASGSTTSRTLGDRFGERFNILDYGAVGDGTFITNGTTVIGGGGYLSTVSYSFVSADIGKMVSIAEVGAPATTTAAGTYTTVSVITVASATGIKAGAIMTDSSGGTVPAGTRVASVSGVTVTLGGNVSITSGDNLSFTTNLLTTIASVSSGHGVLTTAPSVAKSATAKAFWGTDNTTAIQATETAAQTAKGTMYVPIGASGCYGLQAGGLTITGNVSIVGESMTENWNNGINVPLGTPPLLGSVLCPTSVSASDFVDITGNASQVNISNLGVLFQLPLYASGDGFNYVQSSVQGLTGSVWNNVVVYGVDGNHFAYNLQNPIYDTFTAVQAYGGGCIKLYGVNSPAGQYGNSVFTSPYCQEITAGTSNCVDIQANGGPYMNLITMVRPQCITDNIPGTSLANLSPTSTQSPLFEDANVRVIRLLSPDWETNVSSGITLGAPALNNVIDFEGFNLGNLAAFNAPAWGNNGVFYGPQTRAVTDITSSGTVAMSMPFAFPGWTAKASSATTYTNMFTLYVGAPTASTNVTSTRNGAIYANAEVFVNSDLTTNGGLFVTGANANLNNNSSFAVNLCTGTCASTVTVGGASSTTKIGSVSLQGPGGILWESATAPTVTSGLGTSPTVLATNGTSAFKITVGASGSPAAAEVLAMPTATNGWVCTANDLTTIANTTKETATTTTSVTLTWSSAPSLSDVLVHKCAAF